MRFSRVFWLILVTGILITGGVLLFMLYQDEMDEQSILEEQVTLAQAELPGLYSQIGDLEEQLDQREAELAAAQTELIDIERDWISSVDSIEYSDLLFNMANIFDIQILSFTSPGPSTVTIDSISYQSMRFNMAVQGYIYDIMSYLTFIEINDDFTSTDIEFVDSSIAQPGGDLWTTQANISINILSYGGD